jgi:hypothetical protein
VKDRLLNRTRPSRPLVAATARECLGSRVIGKLPHYGAAGMSTKPISRQAQFLVGGKPLAGGDDQSDK